jgi:type I restriction enzyme S subunit
MEKVFKQLQMGSTHKTIYMPDIMKLTVAYPPIEEQRKIAAFLDTKTAEIDSLIEARQTMADKLREYRKSLISEAVTGKFKVPGV